MGIWKKFGKYMVLGSLAASSIACYVSGSLPSGGEVPMPPITSPTAEEVYDTLKVCSFNVEDFGKKAIMPDEADDEDIAEGTGRALAYIMVGCDLTAVQEVSDKSGQVIPFFLDEYLNPIGANKFAAALSPRLGRDASGESQKEQYAFIYDNSRLELVDSFTYDDGKDDGTDAFIREPFVGYFRSRQGDFDFAIAVIHTKPQDAEEEMIRLEEVVEEIYSRYPGETDVICVGDTNLKKGFNDYVAGQWQVGDFYSVIGEDTTLAKSTSLYDQIIIDMAATEEDFTNQSGVIRFDEAFNFSVPADVISDHYPVWAVFYSDRDTD